MDNMKKLLLSCIFLIALVALVSCLPLSLETNDNRALYGSEWSTDDQIESLMFNKDNSVVYRCQDKSGRGTFEYNKSDKLITFDGLTVYWGKTTSVMTSAKLTDDRTMNLYWHKVGKTDNKYEIMYRRR